MSAVALSLHQLRYEQKSYWRNPAAAFFTFAFPILFLVIFASLNRGDHDRLPRAASTTTSTTCPASSRFGVISATYTNLAMTLSIRRDTGILKRLRGTPLPAAVAARRADPQRPRDLGDPDRRSITAVGVLFYDVTFPGHWLALIVALVVGAATFCAIGVAVSALDPERRRRARHRERRSCSPSCSSRASSSRCGTTRC